MTRPEPRPWHDLTDQQKRDATARGLGKPLRRGTSGRMVIEEGWRWWVDDTGRVLRVQEREAAANDYLAPPIPRKRLDDGGQTAEADPHAVKQP